MAKVTHITKIHRPNRPPLEVEHTSGLEEKGALAVLVALGYMITGNDQVWYAREHLTIIENSTRSRNLEANSPRNITAGLPHYSTVVDAPIKEIK